MKIHLNEKELKEYIRNEIKGMLDIGYYEDWLNIRKFKYITEGLTMTFEPNRVKKIIERKYDLKSIGAEISTFNRTTPNHPVIKNGMNKPIKTTKDYNKLVEIILAFPMGNGLTKCNPEILNDIIHTFDACGWMFASIQNMNNYENYKDIKSCDYTNKFITYNMYFRPKFDQEVNLNGIPNICYHITPSRLVEKILREGLKPKNNGRTSNHTERVFLFYNYPEDWKTEIAQRFRESGKNEKYTILKVNIGSWINDSEKNGNMPKFRFDSLTMDEYHPAIYTFETIPPKYISILNYE